MSAFVSRLDSQLPGGSARGLTPSVGPVVQVGLDIDLGPAVALNAGIKWNLLRTDVREGDTKIATLKIDPLTLGIGLRLRL